MYYPINLYIKLSIFFVFNTIVHFLDICRHATQMLQIILATYIGKTSMLHILTEITITFKINSTIILKDIDCITFSYNLIFEFRHLFPKLEAALELNWFNLIFNELLKYFTDPYLFWQIKKMMRGRIDLQNLYERNICHSSCAHKMMFKKWYDIKLFFLVILLLFTLLSLMCITI